MAVYQYSVIRYVPDPIREERMNVGVILVGEDPPFFGSRLVGRGGARRLARLSGQQDFSFLFDFSDELRLSAFTGQSTLDQGSRTWTPERVASAASEWANVLQLSALKPVVGDEPQALLDRLFKMYVTAPAPRPRDYRDKRWVKSRITRGVRRILGRVMPDDAIDTYFTRDARVQGAAEEHRFDYAVKNGVVSRLVETASLELPDRGAIQDEIDLSAWAIVDVRKRFPNLPVSMAVVGDERSTTMFTLAERVCSSIDVQLVRESRLDELIGSVSGEVLSIVPEKLLGARQVTLEQAGTAERREHLRLPPPNIDADRD